MSHVFPEAPAAKDPLHADVPPGDCSFLGIGFALELGYTIAIPALLFGLAGRYADKYLDTSPTFLLLGMLVAFITSCINIFRKIREITRRMPKNLPTPPDESVQHVEEAKDFHEQFRPPSA